jgi:hypothetical protein
MWSFLGQYLSFGVDWRLCEHLRITLRAMRLFLSRITPSRVVFRVILVPRVPRDPLRQLRSNCSRAVFCHNTLDWDDFLTSDDSENPCEWANTVSETGIEPSYVEIEQKLTSVDPKVSMTLVRSFPTLWFCIFKILFQTSNGYIWIYRYTSRVNSTMIYFVFTNTYIWKFRKYLYYFFDDYSFLNYTSNNIIICIIQFYSIKEMKMIIIKSINDIHYSW